MAVERPLNETPLGCLRIRLLVRHRWRGQPVRQQRKQHQGAAQAQGQRHGPRGRAAQAPPPRVASPPLLRATAAVCASGALCLCARSFSTRLAR